jgi:tRNA pseudouridine13 synthase
MTFDPLAPCPLLTASLAGIGGRIKTEPEDFVVEEIPAYEPSGQGEFLYLWIEKRSMGAEYFVRQIARRLDLAPGDVGIAGMKDRHAVTRQFVSVPARAEPHLAKLEGDGIRLLKVSRHGNKLRPGHLRGNRFGILVRGVCPDAAERLPALVQTIREHGLPNFYGPQRFGKDGETVRLGFALLNGERAGRVGSFLRKLALSAVQSALFNHYVAGRMRDNVLRQVLPGDVMAKWPFGGMFVAENLAAEQARLDAREIIPAGPMFGKKMFASSGQAAERESAVLGKAGLTATAFHGFGKLLQGTRRYSFIYIDDLTAEVEEHGVRVLCTLPAGSYATVLLGELMHASIEGEELD